jgi:hypothetical protein
LEGVKPLLLTVTERSRAGNLPAQLSNKAL